MNTKLLNLSAFFAIIAITLPALAMGSDQDFDLVPAMLLFGEQSQQNPPDAGFDLGEGPVALLFPNQAEQTSNVAFDIDKCAQLTLKLLSDMRNTVQYRLIKDGNWRDHKGIFNAELKVSYDPFMVYRALWSHIRITDRTLRTSAEYLVAVKAAIRSLGFISLGLDHRNNRRKSDDLTGLRIAAREGFDFVLAVLPQVHNDQEAWIFLQAAQLAQETGASLKEVFAAFETENLKILDPDWNMKVQAADVDVYPFAQLATGKISIEDLLSSPNSFGQLFGVYRFVIENGGSILDPRIPSILRAQSPERLLKLGRTLKTQVTNSAHLSTITKQFALISQGMQSQPRDPSEYRFEKFLEFLKSKPNLTYFDEPKEHFLLNFNPTSRFASWAMAQLQRNDVLSGIDSGLALLSYKPLPFFESRTVQHNDYRTSELTYKSNEELDAIKAALLAAVKSNAAFYNAITTQLRETGFILLNPALTNLLTECINTVQKMGTTDASTFGVAVINFITDNRIRFSPEAKATWDKPSSLHMLLHFASSRLENGNLSLIKLEKGEVLKSAPRERVLLLSEAFYAEWRQAKAALLDNHLPELYAICNAHEQDLEYKASEGLAKTIRELTVSDSTRELLSLLLVEKHTHKVLSHFDYLRTRLSLQQGASFFQVPLAAASVALFIFTTFDGYDASTTILGSEDRVELRQKFVRRVEDKRKTESKTPYATIQYGYNEAVTRGIDHTIIQAAINDVIQFYRITNIPEGWTDLKSLPWVTQMIRATSALNIGNASPLNDEESAAIGPSLHEWRFGQLQSNDWDKSENIVEAVPCFFIQSFGKAEQETVFPWCALLSERGLEAVVKQSGNGNEKARSQGLLESAADTRLDFAKCQNQGLAINMLELKELMEGIANAIRKGEKILLLASFGHTPAQTQKASAGAGQDESGTLGSKKKRSRSGTGTKDALNVDERHPGLDNQDKKVIRKKKSAKGSGSGTKEQKEEDERNLPDWAKNLNPNGNPLLEMTIRLLQEFALASEGRLERANLLDPKSLALFPKLNTLQKLERPDGTDYVSLLPLRPYQCRAVARCNQWEQQELNGALCLDTGLGKTRVGAELLLRKLIKNPQGMCLVVAPQNVRPQWKTQFENTVRQSAIDCAVGLYPDNKQAKALLEKLFYFPKADRTDATKKRRTKVLGDSLKLNDDSIFELFPIFTQENLERIKEAIASNIDKDCLVLSQYLIGDIKKPLTACNTIDALKELIRHFQARGTLYVGVVLKALKSLHHPMDLGDDRLENSALSLNAFTAFYDEFPGATVTLIKTPAELQAVLGSEDKQGIVVCSESQITALMGWEGGQELLKSLTPSMVVLDEAHQILTQTAAHSGSDDEDDEEPVVRGKEAVFRELIKTWIESSKTPVVALTATPLMNDVVDVIKLLSLVNPNVVAQSSVMRFRAAMNTLRQELKVRKKLCDEHDGEAIVVQPLDPNLVKGCLFQLLQLKESTFDPLIERATWDDEDVMRTCYGQMPRKREIKLKLIPQGKQAERINHVCENPDAKGFLSKAHKVRRYLIHPDLESKEDVIKMTEAFPKKSSEQQAALLSESAFLKALFLDNDSLLSASVRENKKSLIFVEHKNTAALVKAIAQARYNLPDNRVSIIHSEVKNSKQLIAEFEALRNEAAILILLPRSGGAGLDFPSVGLNIIGTAEWTAAQEKQAKGRILRGDGEKTIVNIRYDNPLSKHSRATSKMKGRLMDLLLGCHDRQCGLWVSDLLRSAESLMRSEVSTARPSAQWKNWFRNAVQTMVASLTAPASLVSINAEYLLKRAKKSRRDDTSDITVNELWAVYLGTTQSAHLYFDLIPLPKLPDIETRVSALQFAYTFFNPDHKYDGSRRHYRNILSRYSEFATPNAIALEVRNDKHLIQPSIGNTFEECINLITSVKHLNVRIYTWAEGVWGSHLVFQPEKSFVVDSRSASIQLLEFRGHYSLMVPNAQNNKPLSIIAPH